MYTFRAHGCVLKGYKEHSTSGIEWQIWAEILGVERAFDG